MDIIKLFKKVLESEEMQSIPLLYICMVFNCVVEAINEGECFYPVE